MRKAAPSQLTTIKERMARAKWNPRNVWLRPCHGARCIEHVGTVDHGIAA